MVERYGSGCGTIMLQVGICTGGREKNIRRPQKLENDTEECEYNIMLSCLAASGMCRVSDTGFW